MSTYDARNLLVLEGLEAVRKRPGMYVGSTDTRGLMHCVWEIIDNAVDEALGGHCKNILVVLQADGSVEVTDDGRGIPVDAEKKTGLSGVEVVFTKLHAGGKFGGGSYVATGGLHGVGASVVNALSARLDVEVDKDGATWAMSFRRGTPGEFDGDGFDADFVAGNELRKLGKVKKGVSGTRIRYWADPQVFIKGAAYSYDELVIRARQTSFLVPGLELVIRDERGEEVLTETFRHDGGITEFCDFLAPDEPVTDVVRLHGDDSFTETVPLLDDKGHMTPQEVTRDLAVDIALRWGTGYDTEVRSFVNIIATPKGGTHVQGFERGLTKTFNEVLRAGRQLKQADDDVIKDDVMEGMTAVVTVRLAEPQFEGQTKEVLGTPPVSRLVNKVVTRELKAFLTSTKAAQKSKARLVMEKVVSASRTRIMARQQRDTQRRKNALESSALAGQAGRLPVGRRRAQRAVHRGGRLRAGHRQVGPRLGVPGAAAHPRQDPQRPEGQRRRHAQERRVLVDHPGRGRRIRPHVRHRHRALRTHHLHGRRRLRRRPHPLPARHAVLPLHDAAGRGRPGVHGRAAAAPHRARQPRRRGRRKYVYSYSDPELQRILADLKRRNVRWKDPIQRYKGLGEMDANQLAETTMDPRHRTLRRLTVDDAERATEVFELLMGNEVAPRKEFIVQSAYELDADKIDA